MSLRPMACIVFGLVAMTAGVPAQDIQQSKGVDTRVDYRALTRLGPWDDRNYNLTAEDLRLLVPNEAELNCGIPAFYRVELRRRFPNWMKTGPGQYPRSARQLFEIEYGGLMVDGVVHSRRAEKSRAIVPVNAEIRLNDVLGANEITVEINPVFTNRVIAGANNIFGQEMYFSDDGGDTWTIQGTLPDTCCDPTVGWSSDGMVAYAGALSASIGVNFYRSTDFGETWSPATVLTSTGSDKEFLHVDLSPSSPYKDNVYLTWHDGNVMQFARSRDLGLTFDPIVAFPDAPRGIGSDITTDSAGTIYYFYGAFSPQRVVTMLKSTDGGNTWETPVAVADTNGDFDWPVPSMETRNAWIYAACDADRSGGPFDGAVYVSWTDTTSPESPIAAENHTQVKVARSVDGGQTWGISIPHPIADSETVDRYNQWLTVDTNGIVHVVYYDTRHSTERSGVDLYYTFSEDGGVTWNTPTRVSSQTSNNLSDGQEWGDYNGIAVMFEQVIPAWTDNRLGPPDNKDVYVADVVNITAEPGFFLMANNLNQTVCIDDSPEPLTIDVFPLLEFSNPVTLSLQDLPAGITGDFSVNPVAIGGSAVLTLGLGGGVAAGAYEIHIAGAAPGASDRALTLRLQVQDGPVDPPTLVSPLNGESNAGNPDVNLSWQAVDGAVEYRVQVSLSAGFGTTIFDETVSQPDFLAMGLAADQTYYWRVASITSCAQGEFSPPFSFVSHQVSGQGSEECVDATQAFENAVANGATTGATGTDITSCAYLDMADVWFVYVPPADGVATLSLCGSGFDTTLAIFDECGGTELACNDDWCGKGSQVTVSVDPGEDYWVRISGYGGGTGDYSLLITREEPGEWACESGLPADGGFESGTPNSGWAEYSLNFGTPLCDGTTCNTGVGSGPHTGSWWVWFGGTSATDEFGYVEQAVTIPSALAATLSFYLEIPTAQTAGFVRALIDGVELFAASEADQAEYAQYARVEIDVSPYADGGEHTIRFEGGSTAGGVFNGFVDDVCISPEGAEGEPPVDCTGVTISDDYSGNSGQDIVIAYLDPAAGGAGGALTFAFSSPEQVDRIQISSTDGLSEFLAPVAGSAQLQINSIANGSPDPSVDAIVYTVVYEVESPAGSGEFVAGAPCQLTASWQSPSCAVSFNPPVPTDGGAVQVAVSLFNARFDGGTNQFGTLTSDALGWPGDVVLDTANPGYSVDGSAVVFSPALTIGNWNSALNNGLYSTGITGPGLAQSSECAERAGPPDATVHTADQNENKRIDLSELLRVIQFYNSGGFHCAANPGETEDGFVPGPGNEKSCATHNSDYNPQDWIVNIVELLRLIQFYNLGGYHLCPGDGTEDGFCPGLAR